MLRTPKSRLREFYPSLPLVQYLLVQADQFATFRPRLKPELGDVIQDEEGWSTGGEDSDGGQPRKLVDPHEDLKDPITGSKGISSLAISDDAK